MIKVNQTITGTNGDCLRACIASLLDLEIVQVPHFNMFGDDLWFPVFLGFLRSLGYERYKWHDVDPELFRTVITEENSIGGYILATVPGLADPRAEDHAVIIDLDGVVFHDPHPSKVYQDVNVIESGQLKYIEAIRKQKNG